MNKYGAKKAVCCHGHTHDSKAESYRCDLLHLKQRKGLISDLKVQVKYLLIPAMTYENMPNEKAESYIADFVYVENGLTVIEDVKGRKTRDYIIKRKQMKQKYCTDGKAIFREVQNK